jgi:DNA-binding MarR family transcriptional regulator
VLLDIDEHGQLTMGQLASNLKLDHSTLSRTVDGLVRKKLLARLRDDSDRRLVWIRLTDDGVSVCQEIHEGNDAYCQQVFETIPPSERDSVIRHFEILVQAYTDYELKAQVSKA